ncbi:MAG: tetratricopeptide (TPR) repeat protein [Arenicella sp.]
MKVIAFVIIGLFLITSCRDESSTESNAVDTYAMEPSDYDEKYLEANNAIDNRDFQGAKKIYLELIELDAERADPYVGLACTYSLLEQNDSAKSLYEKAYVIDDKNLGAIVGLGSIAYLDTEYKLALKYYKDAHQKYPDDASSIWGLAISYEGMGNTKEAIRYAEVIVNEHPDYYLFENAKDFVKQYK